MYRSLQLRHENFHLHYSLFKKMKGFLFSFIGCLAEQPYKNWNKEKRLLCVFLPFCI